MIRGIVLSTFNKSTLYTYYSVFLLYLQKNYQKHNKLLVFLLCFMQINRDQEGFFFYYSFNKIVTYITLTLLPSTRSIYENK